MTISDSAIDGGYASFRGGNVANTFLYFYDNGPSFDAFYTYSGGLTLDNVQISGGEAPYAGGVAMVFTSEPLSVTDSRIVNNDAGYVGGLQLYVSFDTSTITNSTISGNESLYGGGYAGYVGGLGAYASEDLTIENTTVSGNHADGRGGGMQLFAPQGSVSVTDSTFADNSADDDNSGAGQGGGIALYATHDASVGNSTIAGNKGFNGGGIVMYGGDASVSSTVVANNSATGEGPDLFNPDSFNPTGPFNVNNSLVEDPSGATITGSNNITGQTPTSARWPTTAARPRPCSEPDLPVIDAGVANGLTTDQRGLPRTFDPVSVPNTNGSDGTDIGATELQAGENGLPGNGECQGAVVPSQTATDAGSVLTGTEGSDQLIGAAGADTLQGLGGNDCLSGDDGQRHDDRRRGQGPAHRRGRQRQGKTAAPARTS